MFGWSGDNGDPDNFFVPLLGCEAVKGGGNVARWCNKAVRGPDHQGGADAEAGRPRQALRAGAGDLQGRGAVDHARALGPLRPDAQGSAGLQDGRDGAPLLHQRRSGEAAVTAASRRSPPSDDAAWRRTQSPRRDARRVADGARRPAMFGFILRRVALIVPTFIGVTLLAFALIHLIPGDPVENLSGERGMDPARRERLLHEFGLDRPLPVQYCRLRRQGAARRPRHVADDARAGAAASSRRCSRRRSSSRSSRCCSPSCVGLPAGILAARQAQHRRRLRGDGRVADRLLDADLLVGAAADPVLLGAARLDAGVGPHRRRSSTCRRVTGFMLIDTLRAGEPGAFRSALSHLILPTIALGTIPLAVIARMTRSSMLEVLREDYVRTARAKGLPRWRVVARPRAAQRADPGRSRSIGLQVGPAAVRRDPHRDDLLLARRRQLADPRRAVARLSGRAGRHPADRGDRHHGQPDRRPAVRRHQPADPPCADAGARACR